LQPSRIKIFDISNISNITVITPNVVMLVLSKNGHLASNDKGDIITLEKYRICLRTANAGLARGFTVAKVQSSSGPRHTKRRKKLIPPSLSYRVRSGV
jgi:hypothetical protein